MKKLADIPNLPEVIKVQVKKGDSGVLLVYLPDYDIFTEAEDLNDLFFQVNDLIYTYFDIPKKYQDKISFVPSHDSLEELVKLTHTPKTHKYSQIQVNTLYSPLLVKILAN